MKAAFEKAGHAQYIAAEWREADAGSGTVASVVMRHACTADLVIASQAASDWKDAWNLDFPDRLALESGRPVLIIPNKGSYQPISKHIVVGWTDRREAGRSVRCPATSQTRRQGEIPSLDTKR
jgi:hypothetical protein